MIRNGQAAKTNDPVDRRTRPLTGGVWDHPEARTIVIRQGTAWQSLAVLLLCVLLLAAVLMVHQALREIDSQYQRSSSTMAKVERKLQQVEGGIGFDSRRRQMLLGMRDYILKTNPRVSLADAFRYAELALEASEKYPAVDPLLLLAIGIVESGYDPMARSRADARGLYQIWPSTGRLLVRALGWNYDDSTLYDPQKNTEAAALYLDVLFATYNDPQMVLAEYNGGPVNAGFFRASARALAPETRDYVPRVLALHRHLQEEFEKGIEPEPGLMHRDGRREGKTLAGGAALTRTSAPSRGRGSAQGGSPDGARPPAR